MNVSATDHSTLLRLRWLQVRRAMPTYGLVMLLVALIGAVFLLHKAVVHDPALAPYIAGGALFVVFGLHQRRTDHHFLQRHLPQARSAMALEYGACVGPVLLVLLLVGAWRYAALLPLALLVPWSPVMRTSGVRAVWLRKRIPAHLFELRSMLQSTHPWSLLLWIAALCFCWLPVLPMFLLGALTLMICGAQEQCEPRAMLLATASDARALLRGKVFGAMRLVLVLYLPVLACATVVRPEWWWIHGLFGIGMAVLVAYAVVLKYANYRPNERLEANSANVSVAALFAILPGLSLVPLIMLLTEVPKASANLKAYFHAHHR